MRRAKICGITTIEDALNAVKCGAWALGFNFYPHSPRYVTEEAAKKIIDQLPEGILAVGLFVDTSFDTLSRCSDTIGLDLIQVYEDIKAPSQFKKRMMLALNCDQECDLPTQAILEAYGYLVLDAPILQDGLIGGTGRLSNWNLAKKLATKYRLILAGGLNLANVAAAIKDVNPYAVDVASGVEAFPGIKDLQRVKQFLEEVRNEN